MEKKRKIGRKSFAAREDLLEQMNRIAKQGDLSLYAYLNDVFEQTIRAHQLDVNLHSLIGSREILKAAQDNGFTLGLESLWYEMAEIAFDKSKKQAMQMWRDAGVWSAKRYVTTENIDPFDVFKNDLKDFTWNIPEFDVTRERNKVSIRIVSPRFTESYTYLFTSYLEGALETFGYKIAKKEASRGILYLDATKE
ncbi:MAG: hypothetical protein WC325_05440 [Candidatus Bathyarchaeia archaeon]